MVQTQPAWPEAEVRVQQPTRMAPPPHYNVAIPGCGEGAERRTGAEAPWCERLKELGVMPSEPL